MKEKEFKLKVAKATKWSTITEIFAKLVMPITNMILARMLVPEAFGVVATITMIISFVEMFTDAGFQKYLVQHEFKDEDEKYKSANVAFWTNFSISIFLFGTLAFFSESISVLVGSPGLGNLITIACVQLPITAFSSIQMALYKREFDFETLFFVRMVSILIPFVITIPLALFGLSYWALIIGTIFTYLSNAIILTIKSKWKPELYFDFSVLKKMLSFSIWSFIEAISIWFTVWIDAFIIGFYLNQHFLGLFKTSTTMVNSIMGLITASMIPVFFATLSRLQNDNSSFKQMFYKFQRTASIFIFPFGIGIFLYSDLVTTVLLGNQWDEASELIGIWALTSAVKIVFCNFSSEVYRAKGRPKLSFLAQFLYLIVLVPTIIVSAKLGFLTLIYARSLIQFYFVLIHFMLMKFAIGFPIVKTLNNLIPTSFSVIIMGIFGVLLQRLNDGVIWSIITIILCVCLYFVVLCFFPIIREDFHELKNRMKSKNHI
ncbi:lipopolysaccharide biosynthesis protein [Peribacillus frigoritolerans]|uniref:lipopolysaccharide biosynthesis protein n=1 Tax=Peribacillus frigoritolerans TaxID=450367 RepID=UPI003ECD864B